MFFERARGLEIDSGRYGLWGGVQLTVPAATHVERLFGFLRETRRRCTRCREGVRSWFSSERVLRVSPKEEPGGPLTVADMYLESCARAEEDLRCELCERTTAHESQSRVVSAPNVLVVQVRREGGARTGVSVEEQLDAPGFPGMQLLGVVYHIGATTDAGHYTCLCRGPGGRFWYYDDGRPAYRMDKEVAHIKPKQVYMVVYCRGGGSATWKQAGDAEVLDLGDGRDVSGGGGGGVPSGGGSGGVCSGSGDSGAAHSSAQATREGVGRDDVVGERRAATETPNKRRLVRKCSVTEVGGRAASAVIREATTQERQSKTRRSEAGAPDGSVEEVVMDEDSILWTPLARKFADLRLDQDIAASVLAWMQERFGQGFAWELACAPWLLAWARWESFVEEVQVAAASWSEGLLVFHARVKIEELLFALQRVVLSQQPRPQRSNTAALHQLLAAGLERRDGMVWGENDCLADSLLQLLIFHGVIPEGVDRKAACLANRARLEAVAELVPRDMDGRVDFGGYLQHHRHAQPTLDFFIEWFACPEVVLPSAGFRLVVHARSDDDETPPDEVVLCEGRGRRAGPRLECHVFNWTGRRHGGYHYDPLVLAAVVVGAVHVGDDGVDDAPERVDSGGVLEVVSEAVGLKPCRVLRHQRAMGGEEGDPATPAGLHLRLGSSAGAVEQASLLGVPDDAGADARPRRCLRRHAALGCEFDVDPLVAALGRLGLACADVEMSAQEELVEPHALASEGVVAEGSVGLSADADRTVDVEMQALEAQEEVAFVAEGAGARADLPALPPKLSKIGGEASGRLEGEPLERFLFDAAPVDASRCIARSWQTQKDKPVFAQCARKKKSEDYCGEHGKKGRPQGIWDPPSHAALPTVKLEEGRKEATRRAAAVASTAPGVLSEASGAQARGGGKGKGRGKRVGLVQPTPSTVAQSVGSDGAGLVGASATATFDAERVPALSSRPAAQVGRAARPSIAAVSSAISR